MRSPSQWPGTVRVAISAGRLAIGVIVRIWPRRLIPRARGRRAVPAAAWPTARCAVLHVARYTATHQSFRLKAVCACRQGTRVGGVRQSARASSLESAVSEHMAQELASLPRLKPWRSPVCAQCRPDRGDPAWCCPQLAAYSAGGSPQHSGHCP